MKSYYVHYQNKYPGCQIQMSESSLDVYSDGIHLVSLVKNGAGQIVDRSEEMGCAERHDLSPIPKKSRRIKLYADGKIAPAEEHDERLAWVEINAKRHKAGFYFVQPGEYEGKKEEVALPQDPVEEVISQPEAPAEEPVQDV